MNSVAGVQMNVKRVLPSASETLDIVRFMGVYRHYRNRGYNRDNAYFLAEQRWCEQARRGYNPEPWSDDYSDIEPAWNREDWVGA